MGRLASALVSGSRGEPEASFALREMTETDLDRVLEIETASFPFPWTREVFSNELRIPFSRALVAHPESALDEVAGYSVRWRVTDEIHLLDLAVAAPMRGRGIARLLVAELLAEARAHGTRLVTLEVAASNSVAQTLYESCGFTTARKRRAYYGAGEDALVMEWRPCRAVSCAG